MSWKKQPGIHDAENTVNECFYTVCGMNGQTYKQTICTAMHNDTAIGVGYITLIS